MCNASIFGKNGVNMSDKWLGNGPSTLHGLMTEGFPNMFLTGPNQAGASPSITYLFDLMARHAAYIVAEATKTTDKPDTLTIESSQEAEDAWVNEIVSRAAFASPVSVCLPSYINNEGALLEGADAMKAMKSMAHPLGINVYAKRLQEWRDEGSMKGLDITSRLG